ncbi:MAG: hypothetical protein ACK56I_02550, partial [bacterium]
MACHSFECRLEQHPRGARNVLQIGMQVRVCCVSDDAAGAVGLETRQLHQQLCHVARAFAGEGWRQARDRRQDGVVVAARRHLVRRRAWLQRVDLRG